MHLDSYKLQRMQIYIYIYIYIYICVGSLVTDNYMPEKLNRTIQSANGVY